MSYQIEITPIARKQLASLTSSVRQRISAKIGALATDPRPAGAKMLKGSRGLLRLRVGDYRVLYRVEDDRLVVLVVKIGHRREVYDR